MINLSFDKELIGIYKNTYLIKDKLNISRDKVLFKLNVSNFMATLPMETHSWVIDVMSCIDKFQNNEFALKYLSI